MPNTMFQHISKLFSYMSYECIYVSDTQYLMASKVLFTLMALSLFVAITIADETYFDDEDDDGGDEGYNVLDFLLSNNRDLQEAAFEEFLMEKRKPKGRGNHRSGKNRYFSKYILKTASHLTQHDESIFVSTKTNGVKNVISCDNFMWSKRTSVNDCEKTICVVISLTTF